MCLQYLFRPLRHVDSHVLQTVLLVSLSLTAIGSVPQAAWTEKAVVLQENDSTVSFLSSTLLVLTYVVPPVAFIVSIMMNVRWARLRRIVLPE